MNNEQNYASPNFLNVINDNGQEVEIPQSEFWQYGWDAQNNPMAFEEYLEKFPILKGEQE